MKDKDGVSALLLVCELAAQAKADGRTLVDLLDDIAREHGLHATDQLSVRFEDLADIPATMDRLRSAPPQELGGLAVERAEDLSQGTDLLPPTDGLRYTLAEGARVIVRRAAPSPRSSATSRWSSRSRPAPTTASTRRASRPRDASTRSRPTCGPRPSVVEVRAQRASATPRPGPGPRRLAPRRRTPACVGATTPPAERAPRTWYVGPGRDLATPSAAAAVAGDGDTVLIDAGTYSGDVATWTQDDLTLRGVGGRAHLRADGNDAQGKAIWVIAGDRTRVDRVEMSGAEVPDQNGAGIRQEGTDLTVTRSWFHDNQDGILTGADPASDIVIRRSRFFRNGGGDGYTHNLYVGAVRSLTVTGSWFWGADVGHELKSRAARTTVVGNLFDDADATASYSIDLPNGGRSLVAATWSSRARGRRTPPSSPTAPRG